MPNLKNANLHSYSDKEIPTSNPEINDIIDAPRFNVTPELKYKIEQFTDKLNYISKNTPRWGNIRRKRLAIKRFEKKTNLHLSLLCNETSSCGSRLIPVFSTNGKRWAIQEVFDQHRCDIEIIE